MSIISHPAQPRSLPLSAATPFMTKSRSARPKSGEISSKFIPEAAARNITLIQAAAAAAAISSQIQSLGEYLPKIIRPSLSRHGVCGCSSFPFDGVDFDSHLSLSLDWSDQNMALPSSVSSSSSSFAVTEECVGSYEIGTTTPRGVWPANICREKRSFSEDSEDS